MTIPRVFTPYTTVATNLLFFTKGEPTKEIWYYEHRYPAGSKNYSKTKPIRIEEFDAEKAWWDNRVESEVAWKVSIDDVRDDWNLDIVNPNRVDAEHRDPVEIFRENEAVSDEIAATQKCLRDALVSASARTHPELDAETFTDSFVHIAEAPGGIQRLRRLIGDLAVRGLLSESNDSDEPVIDLLERLEHRRRALESRSRRPKQKSAAEVADRPFALPAEWQWARLGDVAADIQYGLTAKASAEVLEPAFVRITDIKSSQIKWESVPGCVDSEGDVGRFRLAAGDVLVARSGATVGVSAVVRELPRAAVFASYLIRIVPVEAWLSKWWPILVGSEFYWTQVRSITTGSAQPNINSTNMRGWLIPIPPLQEQHRIVQRVEELWGLCAELEVLYATRAEVRTALASATLHRLAGDGRVRRNTRL